MANCDNPARGAAFERSVRDFFSRDGLPLQSCYSVDVGVNAQRKPHRFDLGCAKPPTLIECKCHTWTEGGNSPSAKMSVWNEAMYYFMAAPSHYRKIFAILASARLGEPLVEHYLKRFKHLVPPGVEVWEIASDGETGRLVYTSE